MIFYTVGWLLFVIGIVFTLFPSKKINRLYGYRSYRAEKDIDSWKYAQKISSRMLLLMGFIGIAVGFLLKKMGWTHFFLIEMILIVFLIVPVFTTTEEKLTAYQNSEKRK